MVEPDSEEASEEYDNSESESREIQDDLLVVKGTAI